MEKVNIYGKLETTIMVIFKMDKEMDKEYGYQIYLRNHLTFIKEIIN
jgi:hypothetical protein